MATPIVGAKSVLTKRYVPAGHRALVIEDGRLTLSLVPNEEAIRYPLPLTTQFSNYLAAKRGKPFQPIRLTRSVKNSIGLLAASGAILWMALALLTGKPSRRVPVATVKSPVVIQVQKTDKPPVAAQSIPGLLATVSPPVSAPVVSASPINATVAAPATPPKFNPAPRFVVPPMASTIPVPELDQRPPAKSAFDKPPEVQRSATAATRVSKEPSVDLQDAPKEEAVQVEIRKQTGTIPATTTLVAKPKVDMDSSFRAVTTNDEALVIRMADGKFKEIQPGQQLPDGTTLKGVDKAGESFKTNTGTFRFSTKGEK